MGGLSTEFVSASAASALPSPAGGTSCAPSVTPWIHGAISIAVLVLAWWLRLSRQDWAILVLTITVVWMGRVRQYGGRAVVDMTMPEPHPLAKVAKDVAAACAHWGAGAILVGLLILGPPLYERIK